MRARILHVLTALLGLALLAVHLGSKERPNPERVSRVASRMQQNAGWLGRNAPEFEVSTLDGATFRLSNVVGHDVVVLNFFATWCAPCLAEMSELDRLNDEMRGRPFRLIAIDQEERPEVVREFVKEHRIRLPVALDGAGAVGAAYGVDSLPTTVMIGPDGTVRLYQVGPVLNAEVAFGDLIRTALSEIAEGKGVTREAFLATQDKPARPTPARPGRSLRGDAGRIAKAMRCPCGCCEQTVADCACVTAEAVRERLLVEPPGGRNDREIMAALAAEFERRSQ